MKSAILHILRYYAVFDYPPLLSEIHRFYPQQISLSSLEDYLNKLVRSNELFYNDGRYARNSAVFVRYLEKERISQALIADFRSIVGWFGQIPTVKLIGISGSLSMLDADSHDDIDLFVITSRDTLWITRAWVLLITRVMSLAGNKTMKNLCWNIFMDEDSLQLPSDKKNEYTAHELLQIKVMYDERYFHHKLLVSNDWVGEMFPNVQQNLLKNNINYRPLQKSILIKKINLICRFFQKVWLEKRGYNVREFDAQAWFIQDDFEHKIPMKLKRLES